MPLLSIVLIVCVLHQLVILEDRCPVLVVFQIVLACSSTATAISRDELLDRDCVSVEVLQRDVREEGDLILFVEGQVDVVLARSLLLRSNLI